MPPDEPLVDFDWVARNLDEIARRLGEHLVMTAIAVVVGFLISFALALAIRRSRRLYGPILAVSGVLYTIPSLALFALLIPITGLSLLSAEIALVSYTVLILVRNIVAGLESVPADVTEAAIGMGFTPLERLRRIELLDEHHHAPRASRLDVVSIRLEDLAVDGRRDDGLDRRARRQ